MLILGIETSCDETSAAIVESGRLVRSNIVASQVAAHAPYGGIVPEIASRKHVEAIVPVVNTALAAAGVSLDDIDQIAATYGPGLAGSLLVGVNFAHGLSMARGLPFVPVNHLAGHIHSVWLTRDPGAPAPGLPLLALIVSGGHTELVLMPEHGVYIVLGRTVDDAAGEAFDKVARLLGLPYPGGPAIQSCAEPATAPVTLPRAWLPGTLDFSFSGLKTAVLHRVYETVEGRRPNEIRGHSLPTTDLGDRLTEEARANIAAGFQQSVVDVLVRKTVEATRTHDVRSVALVGGVAANRALREAMNAAIDRPLFISPIEFATDNAAMIAAAAFFAPPENPRADVVPSLDLAG
ncbi:MAG TPA: tRNA (adenosine(37)-N6)-threonylcarbamoyltransferase complex transferase subunit TsaD [Chloroflexota bacterium]|nr:tRNA (adenosine(37)-N6)-threonylcarbamoyltransferase complex transferase subunit TsaD [Chloroflexota bacterium]